MLYYAKVGTVWTGRIILRGRKNVLFLIVLCDQGQKSTRANLSDSQVGV
jgi:hypothetical protein